jgi:hypothetical protein
MNLSEVDSSSIHAVHNTYAHVILNIATIFWKKINNRNNDVPKGTEDKV